MLANFLETLKLVYLSLILMQMQTISVILSFKLILSFNNFLDAMRLIFNSEFIIEDIFLLLIHTNNNQVIQTPIKIKEKH